MESETPGPRQRAAETKNRRTLSKIIRSVAEIAEDDTQSLTVAAVCQRAGVSTPTFYNHCDSVEKVVGMVIDELVEGFHENVKNDQRSGLEKARLAIRLTAALVAKLPNLTEANIPPDSFRNLASGLYEGLREIDSVPSGGDGSLELEAQYHLAGMLRLRRLGMNYGDLAAVSERVILRGASGYPTVRVSRTPPSIPIPDIPLPSAIPSTSGGTAPGKRAVG